jgi:hypothetical protein
MFFSNNKQTILILTASILIFVVVILSIFLTFNQGQADTFIVPSISSSSSKSKSLNSFEEDQKVVEGQLENSSQIINSSEQNSQSSKFELTQGGEIYTRGEIPTLPPKPSYKFNFADSEISILNKYIDINKLNLNNQIKAEIKDGKNEKILVLGIPRVTIKSQTYQDYSKTFERSNESRPYSKRDRIFLYFTNEKRLAYMGEYINDIQSFQYDNQEYWMINYYGEIIISKPNFENWRDVNLEESTIEDISKKSSFEFVALRRFAYEDFEEYKIETISPQKYIIDGLFSQETD